MKEILRCGKCQSSATYLDRDHTGRVSIACIICGNRYPGGKKGFYMGKQKVTAANAEGRATESQESIPVATPAVRICEECKECPTISAHVRYCARCMGRKGKQAQVDRKSPVSGSQKETKEDPPGPEKASQNRNMKVVVDFSRHEALLRQVEKLAEEELRPLDLQVLSLVKRHFEAVK